MRKGGYFIEEKRLGEVELTSLEMSKILIRNAGDLDSFKRLYGVASLDDLDGPGINNVGLDSSVMSVQQELETVMQGLREFGLFKD